MKIQRVASEALTRKHVDSVRRIYIASFAPSERDPFTRLWEAITSGKREFWLVERDVDVVGFGVTVADASARSVVLEYLAVDPVQRGRGVGGELFEAIVADGRAHCGGRDGGLLFEVERPKRDAAPTDRSVRRIAFYERHGAEIVRCAPDFVAPNMVPGGAPVPLTLMWVDFAAANSPLTGERLRTMVRSIFTVSYELAPDDPIVCTNLEALTC